MTTGIPSKPVSLARRSLFSGRAHTPMAPALRPPWALDEAAFQDTCTTCDKCIGGCAEGIILRGAGGYPVIDFNKGECTFCGDCAEVCAPGALVAQDHDQILPWTLEARVSSDCLSACAVTCRVCGDRCDARAIRFQLAVGGVADPIIDQSLCTGCGACVAPCPVGAVEVVQVQMEELS